MLVVPVRAREPAQYSRLHEDLHRPSSSVSGPEREPALPVVVPEERTAGGNDLCHDRSNGEEGDCQPDDPEIDDETGKGDRRERLPLRPLLN